VILKFSLCRSNGYKLGRRFGGLCLFVCYGRACFCLGLGKVPIVALIRNFLFASEKENKAALCSVFQEAIQSACVMYLLCGWLASHCHGYCSLGGDTGNTVHKVRATLSGVVI
jgi:hypothetical protein